MKRILLIILIPFLAGACATWRPDAPRAVAPRVATAADHLHFMEHLRAADADVVEAIGEDLAAVLEDDPVSADRRLRHALWLAAPGHSGHDAEAALAQLQRLDGEAADLTPATRALVRQQQVQLQQLQRLRAIAAERDQLHERIRALTNIEKQIDDAVVEP